MDKIKEKINRFDLYGYDEATLSIGRYNILQQAYHKSVNFSLVFLSIMGVFSLLALLGLVRRVLLIEYITIFCIHAGIFIYSKLRKPTDSSIYKLICRTNVVLMLLFGIAESISDTHVVATAILALFIVTSTIYTDSMIVYSALSLFFAGVLVLSSFILKAPSIAFGDMINVFTFSVAAISIHYYTQRERIHHFVTSAQLQALRETKLQNEIAVAKEANKAKSIFLSKMSHEIRTPINAILGMDEMILRECHDPQLIEYASNIQNSGHTLLALINEILDFSKIEAGKMDIIPVDYDLSTLINDVVNMASVKAVQKSLRLIVNVSPDTPTMLHGDDIRIKQCLINLLTNAIKYTNTGSITLDIKSRVKDSGSIYLYFSIQDTGVGIKEEDIKKLFSPFERIEEDKNRSIEGTGLGMNIVQQLLALMGTKLQVQSIYGKGSTFSFEVEQGVLDKTPIGDFKVTYKNHVSNKPWYHSRFIAPDARILVIDDNEMNLTVIRGLLKQTEINVTTATSGPEALELIQSNQFDCIFIDHLMPIMDGIETLHRIHELNLSSTPPCIALTANALIGAKEEYLSAGFDDYLSKPIDSSLLEDHLMKYLPAHKVHVQGDKAHDMYVSETESSELPEKSTDTPDEAPLIKHLRTIPDISVDDALRNTGSEELLCTVINEYRNRIEVSSGQIEKACKDENWEEYTIYVHALKSTSKIIGADELSQQCAALEQAGKAGDLETIHSLSADMLCLYRSFITKLQLPQDGNLAAVKGSTDSGSAASPEIVSTAAGTIGQDKENVSDERPPITDQKLRSILSKAQNALSEYDYDTGTAAIQQLRDYNLSVDLYRKIRDIETSLENLDAEIAVDIIDSMTG